MENHEFPRAGHILDMHDTKGPEYAFIVCVVCGTRTREDESEGMDDTALTRAFEAKGWTVAPTRCPAHVGHEVRCESCGRVVLPGVLCPNDGEGLHLVNAV